MLSVPN